MNTPEPPPLPVTCQADEPWVNPWTDETVYDEIGTSSASLWILVATLSLAGISLVVCFTLIALGGWA